MTVVPHPGPDHARSGTTPGGADRTASLIRLPKRPVRMLELSPEPPMPASPPASFQMGDRVLHPAKPEWGAGLVLSSSPATQDGRPCQRLQIRFDRVGIKTISTAFVDLQPAIAATTTLPTDAAHIATDQADPAELLIRLPESASDPFATVASRLKGTLAQYRFSKDGASLFAWASAQTGLADPLSRFNRHELEERFDRWRSSLDAHLAKVVTEAKSLSAAELAPIVSDAPPEAREALKRVNRRR